MFSFICFVVSAPGQIFHLTRRFSFCNSIFQSSVSIKLRLIDI